MELGSNDWESVAVDNITKYLHRGGEYMGDDPQFISGPDLLNTIGIAMGLPTTDPDKWTENQLEMAKKGKLVYYEGKSREAIDAVADQIRYCCCGSDKVYITVLPVELYYEGKLYELPIFRVKRLKNSYDYYVDNTGRYYISKSDWFECNKLPPGKMAYPYELKLSRNPTGKKAHVYIATTPSARSNTKALQALDKVATVAGIGSGVGLMFLSGGLAAPLIGAVVASAGWGTSRAGYQLLEKAGHGENINPITNAESRTLWLGIAANITSFGAMGASMRLTSLAARGREISTTFKVITNFTNGACLAINGAAIINTSVFMINNYEDLSAVDMLLHGVSVAFWTKGLFSYKTARTIIRDVQNHAFAHINTELSQEEASELSALRNRVQNDGNLLRKYHNAMKSNISVQEYTRFLLDGMNYYDTVVSLSPEQIEAFYSVRNVVRDDLTLISGLQRVSDRYNLNPTETVERVINMWEQMNAQNMPSGTNAILKDGNLLMGRAPPIKISKLPQLSPPLIRFLGEHLSLLDVDISRQWISSVDVLLNLQTRDMFACVVTKITNSGRAVIFLNGQLEISIYKLYAMSEDDCKNVFRLISRLSPSYSSSKLSPELVKLCVQKHRLRLECHRVESVKQTLKYAAKQKSLHPILQGDLKSYERDRLYTFVSAVDRYKADVYMHNMMTFVADMRPNNVSELVAYSEFAMTMVEDEVITLKYRIRKKEIDVPRNAKLAVWTREQAAAKVFKNINVLKQKYEHISGIVERHDMVGVLPLQSDLSDSELVVAVKRARVRFGGKVSAAYHVVKHPTAPLEAHVTRANDTIRAAANHCVTVAQDGDVRYIEFRSNGFKTILLEREGRVFLCSYGPC